MGTACRIAARFHIHNTNVRVCNTNKHKNSSGHLICLDYSVALMTSPLHLVEDLVGQSCTHGSPGYPVKEVIENITQVEGLSPLSPIWKIEFVSGIFTYLSEHALYNLLDNGESFYRRAAGSAGMADAIEEIHLIDFADDPRFYPSEQDWE